MTVGVCCVICLAATEDNTWILSHPQAGDAGKGCRDGEAGCKPERISVIPELCIHCRVTG